MLFGPVFEDAPNGTTIYSSIRCFAGICYLYILTALEMLISRYRLGLLLTKAKEHLIQAH